MEFKAFFERYESLAGKVEEAFKRVGKSYPELVMCKPECTDCCNALFDLTLVEAMYIKQHFDSQFSGEAREAILEIANKADRQVYKLKKEAYTATQQGKDEEEIVKEMAEKRIRCPLLNEKDLCSLYAHRPLACRIYGVPLAIGGTGRTCGLSGFKKGNKYPTVNMDIIHDQLLAISSDLARSINSKHAGLSEMLVPVSMALLTDYSEEYLGAPVEKEDQNPETMQGITDDNK